MIGRYKSTANFLWLAVGSLTVLLPILAILQYRWIGEISEAERERLNSSLQVGATRFADDFGNEMSQLYTTFLFRNGFPENGSALIERYNVWLETAAFPRMVQSLSVVKTYPDREPDLFAVDIHSQSLVPTVLPHELKGLRDTTQPSPKEFPSNFPTIHKLLTMTAPIRGPEAFLEMLLRPYSSSTPRNQREPTTETPIQGWAIIELDRNVFLHEVVPTLIKKHFIENDETAYRVALVDVGNLNVLYSSDGSWNAEEIQSADANIYILGDGSHEVIGKHGVNGPVVLPRPEFPKNAIHGEHWLIAVRHRLGSLETAVTQARQRNLAISFGVLAVLAGGVLTIGISSQRTRKMAGLQMEFAAGVSHEIRTPLAVIRSAAHNLRRGVVSNKEDIERYATMVEDEARRLSATVDQVLLYSETNSDLKKYELAPVDVNEIIDRAVNNLSPSLDINLCQLTTHIDTDLPPVLADASALTQCVQNLLSNAFKYGRKGPCAKIEITASMDEKLDEVKLRIRDNGPGIDTSDQRYLFRPFYRGTRSASKIPGNGLGLYLVHRIMAAQRGSVTLDPSSGGGASFTLHIPVSR